VTIIEWAHGCFTEAPLPPWNSGFRPEPTSKLWTKDGAHPGVPIACARGMAGWSNCGVILFSSGFIGTAGTVTARGSNPTYQLPPNKLPTAVSVTNKNEFALVTVVDTESHKGQVAVFGMTSNGKATRFVHEWQGDYPCLPNVAVYTGMKLLGYVDLPFEFPTSVCAVGNAEGGRMNGRDGNAGLLREYDLAKQADRDVFFKGSNKNFSSTTGFAIVAGKYENKAALLDLQPLFEKAREMFFTTEENYQKSRDLGDAPNQWPYAFDHDASLKPAVVATVDVPAPTAVFASLSGGDKARALIASQDGTVGIYTVGGLATTAPATADEVKRVSEIKAGRNTTCLTYQKGKKGIAIAVSRGDRELEWIDYSTPTPTITRRLRDARLKDPVNAESADTHGIETPLITVADFGGQQILNYRYGVVKFATQGGAKFGMGKDGMDEVECGGVMSFPGKVVGVSGTNVN
jgi:hypothetical protein